jgi:acetyl-CoA carboxylase biotin carboxylase subunit
VSAAVIAEVDAIHPGYGMLSERAHFAEICETHGIKFIGPTSRAIELMGDKATAKQTMREAGVPVIPGGEGIVATEEQAMAVAEEVGYPVIVKAAAGGGGKGMRVANNKAELLRVFVPARSEAEAAFGNPDVYIEKLLEEPRHIEIQIIADSYGNVAHLGERECSLQRRHQKVLEESPSSFVTPELRKRMGESSVRGVRFVNYTSIGTIEYLVDKNGDFYFMEMNTRVQVEHPVTEMVTGIDIVKEQIRIAAGEKLSFCQDDVQFCGHAIECRINAEDPYKEFMPSPGVISYYQVPGGPGVRVDGTGFAGYVVPPYYDSLVAKLICHAPNRPEAIRRAQVALEEFVIEAIATTIPFHKALLANKHFQQGAIYTDFLNKHAILAASED